MASTTKRSTSSRRDKYGENVFPEAKSQPNELGDRSFLLLISRDVIYGFIFWSLFQGLAPMVWFYPLNELGISGYEAFCVVWLSPILCLLPGVFNLLQNKLVVNLLRLIAVASVASFQAPSTLTRLVVLALGTGAAMLVLTATLASPNKDVRYRAYWGLILGFHTFLCSRIWFITFVPTWWNNASNTVVITFGIIAFLGYSLEETSLQKDSSDRPAPHGEQNKHASNGEQHEKKHLKVTPLYRKPVRAHTTNVSESFSYQTTYQLPINEKSQSAPYFFSENTTSLSDWSGPTVSAEEDATSTEHVHTPVNMLPKSTPEQTPVNVSKSAGKLFVSKHTEPTPSSERHTDDNTNAKTSDQPHPDDNTNTKTPGRLSAVSPAKSTTQGQSFVDNLTRLPVPDDQERLSQPHQSPEVSGESANIEMKPHWLPCGVGLGSLLCLTHMCFGEVSLICRWTVQPFPHPGPVPLLWGSCVVMALSAGSSTLWIKERVQAVLSVLAAAFCFLCLYLLPYSYLAFTAGCCLAFLTMSLWPVVVDIVTQSQPALCFAVAGLTYIFQILFFIWTVAYNFVPYGVYTREHTDWLILIIIAGILFPVILYSRAKESFTVSNKEISNAVPSLRTYWKVLMIIFLVSHGGMFERYIKYKPGFGTTDKLNQTVFTAGIWTFHFGYDNQGWPSMERATTLIKDTGVDVLTLLESDASKPFLGNNDLATWLAEKLNFYVDFGPSTKDHTWGNLILSRYPIVKSVHHLLPSPYGELAPAMTASINISGRIVDFVVTHMGNDRDVLDRKLQAQVLATELKHAPGSAVFLGYVTSSPGSDNFLHLINEGQVKDIDPSDGDRWCEYIMYKKLIRLGYARITHGGLSDTEIQLARFAIPEDLDYYKDNLHTTYHPHKQGIDESILFNKKFGSYYAGHGNFDGHGFHMSTPKYFYSVDKKRMSSGEQQHGY